VLTSEEEIQYRENAPSLLDAATLRSLTANDNNGVSSVVVVDTRVLS
jgi:hypothetical protein